MCKRNGESIDHRAGNFDTTREPDTKLAGLGRKRVDPFTTRSSYLNGLCCGSPAGDLPDLFKVLVFFFFFFNLKKKKKKKDKTPKLRQPIPTQFHESSQSPNLHTRQ
jgi:hypothetical protein